MQIAPMAEKGKISRRSRRSRGGGRGPADLADLVEGEGGPQISQISWRGEGCPQSSLMSQRGKDTQIDPVAKMTPRKCLRTPGQLYVKPWKKILVHLRNQREKCL